MRKLAVSVVVALGVVAFTACSGGSSGSSPQPTAIEHATRQPASALSLPPGIHTDQVWQLPTSMRASAYGTAVSARYAFFGLASAATNRDSDADVTPGERRSYAALNLENGEIARYPAVDVGRTSSLGLVVSVGADDYLIHREEQPRPAEECPQSPQYCWTWSLYAQRLPDGKVTQIGAADKPGPQFTMPRPVAFDGGVAWLADSEQSGDFDLVRWTPSDSSAVIAQGLPWGGLSIDDGSAWIGVNGDESTPGQLWSVNLRTGATGKHRLPVGACNADVVDKTVQYVLRNDGEHPMSVVAAPVVKPAKSTVLARGLQDVYVLVAVSPHQAVISDPTGVYRVFGVGGGVLTSVPQLWGVHRSNGKLSFFVKDADAQTLVVAH